jgi:monoamine oxidase
MRSGIGLALRKIFRETRGTTDYGRRDFVRKAAVASVALSLPWAACQPKQKPAVAIVGGGIAGLTTSFYLSKMGIDHTLYEASGRVGGRIFTVQNAVIDNAYVDFGAEFIDSIHEDILQLANELSVPLIDLHEDTLTSKAYYFEGKMYTEKDIVEALQPFAAQLATDVDRIPDDIHFSAASSFRHLDQHSVSSYLESIGMEGWLKRFFEVAMESEYALDAGEQSAINLLVMLSTPVQYDPHYHLLGNYHEVYKFKGGSQKFIDALSAQTRDRVKMGYRLRKINRGNGKYALTFDGQAGEQLVLADYVVLAIPFTVLRKVERNFSFSDRKEKWIAEAGFGNAVKAAMGFTQRPWRNVGFQGYTFTDVNGTVFWDSAQAQPVEQGSLTFAGGGRTADALADLPEDEIVSRWMVGADTIFKGIKSSYNNRLVKFPWKAHPYSEGSYTCYKPGQWSAFAGVEAEPFENILFAGEHCSIAHQGFMNGAAETGRLAAAELGKRLAV